jgi:hypothetical protein
VGKNTFEIIQITCPVDTYSFRQQLWFVILQETVIIDCHNYFDAILLSGMQIFYEIHEKCLYASISQAMCKDADGLATRFLGMVQNNQSSFRCITDPMI